MVQVGESHRNRAAFHFNEVHFRDVWFGGIGRCSLFCTWALMVTRNNDHRLYFGIVVFADWYPDQYSCSDLAFDWKKITMPACPRYPMPDFIRDALNARGLMDAHLSRPSY